jgi:hypothetical protein
MPNIQTTNGSQPNIINGTIRVVCIVQRSPDGLATRMLTTIPDMRVSIGIFAHNEEKQIGRLLASLADQHLVACAAARGMSVEIITLANGCTDLTEETARAANADLQRRQPAVRTRTEVISETGKSNAWNIYVHRFSDPSSDFLIFMDADITLIGAQTLWLLVETLVKNESGHVSVDSILKDLALKKTPSLVERVSLRATFLTQAGPLKLAGSLYCARARIVRKIWMPRGLLVEDGFLKAMITTDRFTMPEDPSRLVRAEKAAHTFHAITEPLALLRHEVRLLIGTWMNRVLFAHLQKQVCETNQPAGDLVRAWNDSEPNWLQSLLRAAPTYGTFLGFSGSVIILPVRQALTLPRANRLKGLATAFAGTLIRKRIYKW